MDFVGEKGAWQPGRWVGKVLDDAKEGCRVAGPFIGDGSFWGTDEGGTTVTAVRAGGAGVLSVGGSWSLVSYEKGVGGRANSSPIGQRGHGDR